MYTVAAIKSLSQEPILVHHFSDEVAPAAYCSGFLLQFQPALRMHAITAATMEQLKNSQNGDHQNVYIVYMYAIGKCQHVCPQVSSDRASI